MESASDGSDNESGSKDSGGGEMNPTSKSVCCRFLAAMFNN